MKKLEAVASLATPVIVIKVLVDVPYLAVLPSIVQEFGRISE